MLSLVINSTKLQAEEGITPASKSQNGQYQNRVGDLNTGPPSVRAAFLMRRLGTMFRSGAGAAPLTDKPPTIDSFDSTDSIGRATWIGHATVLLQLPGLNLLTDPIWSSTPSPVPFLGPSRFVEPGLSLAELPSIDAVVISHNHYDHLDIPTLKSLARLNTKTQFLVPLGNEKTLLNAGITGVKGLNWGGSATVNGYEIVALPAQHGSKRSLRDTNRGLWSAWAVIGAEKRFYFAGDTGYFEGFKAIGRLYGPFDLAAVPIGAYEPAVMMKATHMNPEEAIAAARDVRAKQVLAIHYGTFDLSDEPLDEPPKRFRKAALAAGFEANQAWVLDIGGQQTF